MIVWLTLCTFLCGSLMFSYWIGVALKLNIRSIGDGNPGAANLWKMAGYKYGMTGVALDFAKGYLPLMLIMHFELVNGYELIPVALAPMYGHAFSPFLKGKGGKGIAVTFGVWSAITYFEASLAYAVILALFQVVAKIRVKGGRLSTEADSLHTTFGLVLLAIYLWIRPFAIEYLWIWLGNIVLLLYTNRVQLMNVVKNIWNNQDHDLPV